MKNKRLIIHIFQFFVFCAVLSGCSQSNLEEGFLEGIGTEIIPTAQVTVSYPTMTPDQPVDESTLEEIYLTRNDASKVLYREQNVPNLWTQINPEKMTIYPYDRISDYAFDADKNLWLVGGFGVIRRTVDGELSWYSMKNGLNRNRFTRIRFAPNGEVWIGGRDNALFRFDGENWIDEGQYLPEALDDQEQIVYPQRWISAIDFDQDGNPWVINSQFELYTKVYDQWINYFLPKKFFVNALGGGSPNGLLVNNANDILIRRSGCCQAGPDGFYFDGEVWSETKDFEEINQILKNQREDLGFHEDVFSALNGRTTYTDWPFADDLIFPVYDFSSQYGDKLTVDQDGDVWFGANGKLIKLIEGNFVQVHPNENNNEFIFNDQFLLEFPNDVVFFDEEGRLLTIYLPIIDKKLSIFHPTEFYEKNHFAIDKNGKVWFYFPQSGLYQFIDFDYQEKIKIPAVGISQIPGSILAGRDGSIFIGDIGRIWKYDGQNWSVFTLGQEEEMIQALYETESGQLYAASATQVFEINLNNFKSTRFVLQNTKPIVDTKVGLFEESEFYKRHTEVGSLVWMNSYSPRFTYESLFLGESPDGSVIYINNHLVAKQENGQWKTFVFDSLSFDSAVVDGDGMIWLFSESDGVLRLEADIFDDFVIFERPEPD